MKRLASALRALTLCVAGGFLGYALWLRWRSWRFSAWQSRSSSEKETEVCFDNAITDRSLF